MGGEVAQQEAHHRQRHAGGQDGGGDGGDRADDCVALAHGQPVLQIAVGEQDGVVHRRAQLNRADDQVGDVEDRLIEEVGQRQVDPDGRLDGQHQDHRQRHGLHRQQQHHKHRGDGEEVDLAHVDGDGAHQVLGAHAFTCQLPRTGIPLLRNFADAVDQVEGGRTLEVRVHAQHQAAVIFRHQQLQRVLPNKVRGDGGACDIHIGQDAGDLGDRLQLLGELALPHHVAPGHHQHVGVALAEGRLNRGGVRAQLGVRTEDVGGAVVVLVAVGGPVGGIDQHEKDQHRRDHQAVDHLAQRAEGGQKIPVAGPFH